MGLTDSQIDEAAHELQRVIEQCGGEPSEFPYDYLRGILEKLPSSAGGGEPTEPSPCEEAARADLVDELDSMRAVFDGAGNFHHVLSRAMAWINGERAGPVEQPSEAPAIAEWRKARTEFMAATEAYNVAHRAALEKEAAQGFGFANLTKEFSAMTEASNKMHRLARPALDALYATPAIAVAAVQVCCQDFNKCREMCVSRADYWQGKASHLARSVATVDGREAFTTRQLIEGAWCAGYYHAGYTNDSAYADQQATRYADAALTPSPGAAVERGGSEHSVDAPIPPLPLGDSASRGGK